MVIEIPDQILEQGNISKEKMLLEFAVYLFKEELVSLGRGALLANLSQAKFQAELAKRRISLHYDETDLLRDVATLERWFDGRN